jgi:hypothetical protein
VTALVLGVGQPFSKGRGVAAAPSTDPFIFTINPNTAIASATPITVTVNGIRFTATSVVYANAAALTTTFVSANQLTALYTPATAGVVVFTVHEGAVVSNSRDFTITAATGGFLPSDITGLQTWYDSSDVASFTFSSGSVVSQWRDKSVNARHFAQGTVAAQPSRTGVINSLPTVLFDAINDYLDTGSFTVAQPLTVFFVSQLFGGYPVNFGFSSIGGDLQLNFQSLNRAFYAGEYTVQTGIDNDVQPHLWSFVLNGASSQSYYDGTLSNTSNPGPAGTTTGFRIAERNLSNFPQAHVAEIVVYNSVLSTTDRQNVENYLKAKWMAFTPSSITGLQGWWDSSDAAMFAYSSGTVVSQWRDKSVNARHFSQGTVASQPNRNGVQNGLATVGFDAVNDYLDTASFSRAQPYTVLLAVNLQANCAILSSVSTNALQIYRGGEPNIHAYTGSDISYSSTAADLQPNVWSVVINGASSAIYRNGVLMVAGDLGSTGITTGLRMAERNLNASSYFYSAQFEIVLYDTALGTTDRQAVEAYLKAKWGTL